MRKPKERRVSDLSARARSDMGDKGPGPLILAPIAPLTVAAAPLTVAVPPLAPALMAIAVLLLLLWLLLCCPCPRTANTSFSLSDHTVPALALPLAPPPPLAPPLALALAVVMFSQSFGAQNGVPLVNEKHDSR